MIIRRAPPRTLRPDQPILHEAAHKRPRTRRDFIAQGLASGFGTVIAPTVFSLFANPQAARAALSPDLQTLRASCGIDVQGAGKIPFICIDLAGGANMVGSNVLIGGAGGQLDFLSTQGYAAQGLPGDMLPGMTDAQTGLSFTNTQLGLAFHSDSAFLRGILDRISPATAASINGAVIAARSENDTGNNPHNPMYGIFKAGADGSLLSLIGSRASESGGNSLAPMAMMARATSGGLAADPVRIGELAERLRNRRPLVVRDPSATGASLRRIEVVWLGGDGRTVPALPWAVSQTPPELGVARLLSAVESATPLAGAPLWLRRAETGAGSQPLLCFAIARARGPLRLLWWSAAKQKIEIGEPTSAVQPSPESSDSDCVPLPEGLGGDDLVQLEALDSLEWGAGRLSSLPGG